MAAIRHAVVVFHEEGAQVGHLYQHRVDAEHCAEAYCAQLGVTAWAAELSPALPVARHADAWAVLASAPLGFASARGPGREAVGPKAELRLYASAEAAGAAETSQRGSRRLTAPIRRHMPVQGGVPRFTPARRPALGLTEEAPAGAAPPQAPSPQAGPE